MTECANCGNERIMLCPFCEHDFSERSKNNEAELRQLRREVAGLRKLELAVRKHVMEWNGHPATRSLLAALKALEAAREG